MGTAISEEARHFLGLIARAAFANPFGPERHELDIQIIEATGKDVEGQLAEEVGLLSIAAVEHRLGEICEASSSRLESYSGLDRELMRTAFLYRVFHRFLGEFDQLIQDQIKAGDAPCETPFALDILQQLEAHGFSPDEAIRFLGFFFQLRRAYFLIRHSLIGESPSLKELRRHLWNTVFTSDIRWYELHLWNRMEDFSTLLLGETGTGKGTAAAAIGRSIYIPFDKKKKCFKESFTRNFIALNLSRFPETIIESELFGHRKGAFTGAVDHYEGVFARCSPHVAVFLDEVGEIPAHIQIKLLEVLQERTFSPVGSHERTHFPSRVIAATNKPLDKLREEGEMRDDFFYRLCSNIITLPPLRVRIREAPEEFDLLLGHVVQRTIGKQAPQIVKIMKRILKEKLGPNYGWPGNVRELEQAARNILITRSYAGDTKKEPMGQLNGLFRAMAREEAGAYEILSTYCSVLYREHGSYEAVSRITGLDRRTIKKYLSSSSAIETEGEGIG